MIKITSISVSYRQLRMAWHYILSLSKSKCSSSLVSFNAWTSQRLFKSNPQVKHRTSSERLLHVLNLVRPLTVRQKICHKENSESEQRTMHALGLRRARASSDNDRSSHSRVRIRSTTSERVTHLHITVPAITRGSVARPHELENERRLGSSQSTNFLPTLQYLNAWNRLIFLLSVSEYFGSQLQFAQRLKTLM